MWSGKSPDLGNETYVVSYLGRAQAPLNCPASLVLEFQSIGNKSPVALPSEGPIHLLSDNEPLCIHHLPSTVIKSLQILYHPHASHTSSHPFSDYFEAKHLFS